MATIRELVRKDGGRSYHAEVRLKGHPPQRATFRTRTQAKQWVQDTESAIRDGRHFKTIEAKRHTVSDLIDRFSSQWLAKFPHRQDKQARLLEEMGVPFKRVASTNSGEYHSPYPDPACDGKDRFCALDFDEAGKNAYAFWKSTYPNIKPWPVPKGKSPGDAYTVGINSSEWVKAGVRS